jgi:hypothetical protein
MWLSWLLLLLLLLPPRTAPVGSGCKGRFSSSSGVG